MHIRSSRRAKCTISSTPHLDQADRGLKSLTAVLTPRSFSQSKFNREVLIGRGSGHCYGIISPTTLATLSSYKRLFAEREKSELSNFEQFTEPCGVDNGFLKVTLCPPSVGKAQQTAVLLCIDDSPDLLEYEKEFLETFGYTVLTAPSGSKGLELATIHAVDVVIVDYFMPEMNGHEFAVEMRRA
jgi:hypothetical protein